MTIPAWCSDSGGVPVAGSGRGPGINGAAGVEDLGDWLANKVAAARGASAARRRSQSSDVTDPGSDTFGDGGHGSARRRSRSRGARGGAGGQQKSKKGKKRKRQPDVCRYFRQEGGCKFGANCRNSHAEA